MFAQDMDLYELYTFENIIFNHFTGQKIYLCPWTFNALPIYKFNECVCPD